MHSVQSSDGTQIAFEQSGEGPPLILVDGAMCYREVGWSTKLAKLLAPQFTVFTYDRRGRGQSGDTQPYAAEREIEDLLALIGAAGGSAFLYDVSSGGAVALETAARDSGVEKLLLYEVPFNVEDRRLVNVENYQAQLHKLLAADRRGVAVKLFLRQVGLPRPIIGVFPLLPMWSKLTAIAHTLAYDNAILAPPGPGLPVDRWAAVSMPTLTVAGTRARSGCSTACRRSRARCRTRSTGHLPYVDTLLGRDRDDRFVMGKRSLSKNPNSQNRLPPGHAGGGLPGRVRVDPTNGPRPQRQASLRRSSWPRRCPHRGRGAKSLAARISGRSAIVRCVCEQRHARAASCCWRGGWQVEPIIGIADLAVRPTRRDECKEVLVGSARALPPTYVSPYKLEPEFRAK